MSLKNKFEKLLREYPRDRSIPFAGNPIAKLVRVDIPEILRSELANTDRYMVTGSAGQGNWARSPWVGVFDRLVTETA